MFELTEICRTLYPTLKMTLFWLLMERLKKCKHFIIYIKNSEKKIRYHKKKKEKVCIATTHSWIFNRPQNK